LFVVKQIINNIGKILKKYILLLEEAGCKYEFLINRGAFMKELQEFTKEYQKELNYHIKSDTYDRSKTSLLTNHMLLTTEVAEIAELLRELFVVAEKKMNDGMEEGEAFSLSKELISQDLGKEISDCIAYLCKLSNFFNRNMEEDFYSKMEEVKNRVNI
jgi:NTP pyrophosphatase (non-canonical NTP hydrolase)